MQSRKKIFYVFCGSAIKVSSPIKRKEIHSSTILWISLLGRSTIAAAQSSLSGKKFFFRIMTCVTKNLVANAISQLVLETDFSFARVADFTLDFQVM